MSERNIFPFEEKCVGASCPIKSHCKLYLLPSDKSKSIFRPPYKKVNGKIECEKYEESFGDIVEQNLKRIPA